VAKEVEENESLSTHAHQLVSSQWKLHVHGAVKGGTSLLDSRGTMAKVPDLGTDFAQKLLKDLRQHRERLGFESAAAQSSTASVVPRGKFSCSPAFFEKSCQ
jgi:hypothetical protein